MHTFIDAEFCAGCGKCVEFLPEVFGMAPDAHAFVRMDRVVPELEEDCVRAAEDCPGAAIRFEP